MTAVEESLFLKGKKFCPVEKDPPIIRMQTKLNNFFRNMRIEWFFRGQEDKRSELERKFYPKSDWCPPKACVEIPLDKSRTIFPTVRESLSRI